MLSFFEFFYDPLFRGPFWGTIFMAIASSFIGCIALVRKKMLFGESLSHSAYPGVILGMLFAVSFGITSEASVTTCILFFGFVFALMGFYLIELLRLKCKVSADTAQCYILASFLGLGLTLASIVQKSHGMWYRKMQAFLFGQAATMNDFHIALYGVFAIIMLSFVLIFYPYMKAYLFDPLYCRSIGLKSFPLRLSIIFLFALSVVIGMRSVGTILMCGMLVAPAICAKQLTQRFSTMMVVASIIGALSSALGVYLSMVVPEVTTISSFPTGPAIVLVASCFCLLTFLISPRKGLCVCIIRKFSFRNRCVKEHLLKSLWKNPSKTISKSEIIKLKVASRSMTSFCLYGLYKNGWVQKDVLKRYSLTEDGKKKAAYIVRLHRLWELYLSRHLGFSENQIHRSAEEMEHVISPEVEKKLTSLLLNPKKDPHNQPIPQKGWIS